VPPVCVGLPAGPCRQNAGSDFGGVSVHGGVIKIVVTCSKRPCTDAAGEGDTVISFADGTTQSYGWAYATAS
jgi:hypothetical protein